MTNLRDPQLSHPGLGSVHQLLAGVPALRVDRPLLNLVVEPRLEQRHQRSR